MENQSQNQAYRRHRGNRQGGRGRNRQGKQSQQGGGNASGGPRRSRNRNGGNGGRSRRQPEQTTAQKILSILTFGLLGKPKSKVSAKAKVKTEKSAKPAPTRQPAAQTSESKKPKRNRAEVTSGRLYVGNLDYATGEAELEDLFRGVGNVLSAEVVTNPRTQQSKGFAFVEMGSIEEAKRAVGILDDQEFMGRRLIVSGARNEGLGEDGDEAALAGSSSESHA